MICLNHISKRYKTEVALNDISFDVNDSETTVLLGNSGCGKSTLLKIVAGLIPYDSGSVSIGNKSWMTDNPDELHQQMGYVIQEGGLFPHLSAQSNIELLARVRKKSRTWRGDRVKELCELTHFPIDLLKRYPFELSGGQRQRVGLMRALMLDPNYLLMDEPLGALDPIVRRELQEELKSIFQRLNKTVLLVTHDLGEAHFFADQIILLRDGRVVQKGNLHNFVQNPADPFVTQFIHAQRGITAAELQ